MHSRSSLLVVALAFFSSIVKANEIPGNVALCISDSGSGSIGGGKTCLGPVIDGIPRPSFQPRYTDSVGGAELGSIRHDIEDTIETPVLNWRYDNGLLRAIVVHSDNEEPSDHNLCLVPDSPITTESSEPIDLALRECPQDDAGDFGASAAASAYGRSVTLSRTQEMRFVMTVEGRIVSLAPIVDASTGRDETGSKSFCLTMMKKSDDGHEKACLTPCHGKENPDPDEALELDATSNVVANHHFQVFDVYGTYSDSFLMPLKQNWNYDESVLLAYQFGLPRREDSSNAADLDAYIEVSMPWQNHGSSVQITEPLIIDKFPLPRSSTGGGFLSFVPSDYNLDGRMTASLKELSEADNDEDLVGNEVSFLVSKANVAIGKGPNGQYVIFTIVLGCFLSCFILSILAERICGSKTRTGEDEDSSNDGKTVCISVEEEEEGFALEDDDLEEATTSRSGEE